MPIYEYKCLECGTHLEKMRKVTDAPLTVCENCGGKLEKQWSLSGFQFKGEGWYVTDYAGKKSETAEKTEKTEKAEKAQKDGKTEKTEKTEKSSPTESTAGTDSASKTKSDSSTSSAKEAASKKD
ncbi:MAG: hypothetical protein M3Q99_02345 [Acidobacteriota bacterium]|nr:hypothetical protein [Acidobacteriota bacterium]